MSQSQIKAFLRGILHLRMYCQFCGTSPWRHLINFRGVFCFGNNTNWDRAGQKNKRKKKSILLTIHGWIQSRWSPLRTQIQLRKFYVRPLRRARACIKGENVKCFFLFFLRLCPCADYIRECIANAKDDYRGRRSWTKSNITCQAWADNSINEHT